MSHKTVTLNKLEDGERGVVLSLGSKGTLRRRFRDIGIISYPLVIFHIYLTTIYLTFIYFIAQFPLAEVLFPVVHILFQEF